VELGTDVFGGEQLAERDPDGDQRRGTELIPDKIANGAKEGKGEGGRIEGCGLPVP
jgi:hypothetical protein